jgi:hypothetical protein
MESFYSRFTKVFLNYLINFLMLGIEYRGLHMLGKCSTTELHPPAPQNTYF